MSLKLPRLFLSLFLVVTVVGCGSVPSVDKVLPDRKMEYKKVKQVKRDLEIPPDLTRDSISNALVIPSGNSSTYSEFVNQKESHARPGQATPGGVLPVIERIEMKRDGDQRWLVIEGTPEDIWYQVLGFWHENGILLTEQDPSIGIMVTDWLENRANIKRDFITNQIRKVLDGAYTSATRDQYRVRLERGEVSGITELYLTQRGMEEEIINKGAVAENQRTGWIFTGTDHGLEAEMLRRLMLHLGVANKQASRLFTEKRKVQLRSHLNRGHDQVSLRIKEGFSRAWRLTGVALDRVGFAVEDRDRSKGVYFVRYNDPMRDEENSGLLSKLAFWRDNNRNTDKENRYQVALKPENEDTQIVILDEQGRRENSETAVRILTLLHEQIR